MTNPYYNYTDGVPISGSRGIASLIQAEYALIGAGFDLAATAVAAKSAISGQTYTGVHDFSSGGVYVPTQAPGTNTTQAASTAFVVATSLAATLPGQGGNAGKFITTNGSVASWTAINPVTVVSATTQTAVAGNHYALTNVAASTLTLPSTPTAGDMVWVTWTNSLATNVIARNGQTIMGLAEDMTLNASTNGTVQLRFVNSSWRIL